MSTQPGTSESPSLNGIVVGIPAARRAAETARLVERWGGTPLVGPTVEEVEVRDPGPVLEATRSIIDAPAAWSLHLTGVGTRRWFAIAETEGLLPDLLAVLAATRLVARGQKASSALRSAGLEPEWVPAGETTAEITEWMEGRVAPGELVALQRHGEPVPKLTGPLEAAGARVVEVATYHWSLPSDVEPARRLLHALVGGGAQALVVTSAPQIRNLFSIAAEAGLEDALQSSLKERVFLASVGSVASTALTERGLAPDLEASPPRLGALLRSLAAAAGEVSRKAAAGAGKAL